MKMVGVLLSAGASQRMGRPKALVKSGRETFVAHGIRTLWAACDSVVVVLGSGARAVQASAEQEFQRMLERGALTPELSRVHARTPDTLEVHFLTHPLWRRGMLSSAVAGLREALQHKPEAVLVMPVDHPAVKPATVAALATVMHEALAAAKVGRTGTKLSYALVPRHRGLRGHPVALSATLARAIVNEDGARDLADAIRRQARLVGYLDVRDAGVVRNVNRPGDRPEGER